MAKSVLDDVFSAPEKDLKTFEDTIEDLCKDESSLDLGDARSLGVIKKHKKQQKFITIEYMWKGDDFVWYVVPHPRKTWQVDATRLILVIAKIMNRSFPKDTRVDIWRPIPNTVPEWSFKAFGVRGHWSFNEKELDSSIEELLTTLNTLV